MRDRMHPAAQRLMREADEGVDYWIPNRREARTLALYEALAERSWVHHDPDLDKRARFVKMKRVQMMIGRRMGAIARVAQASEIRFRIQMGMVRLFKRDQSSVGWTSAEIAKSLWFDRDQIFDQKCPTKSQLLKIVGLTLPRLCGPAWKRRAEAARRRKSGKA